MTVFVLGLSVMAGIVAGVSLFGALWLRVERRQAEERARKAQPWYVETQGTFTFSIPKHNLETLPREGR